MSARGREPIGTFCLVLHTHLPWLAHHGSWPVGEEWLHQSWAMSYDRVTAVLEQLADQGRTNLLTLGVTPTVAAQLDDPYCLAQQHVWLGDWYWRAVGLSAERDPTSRALGAWEAEQARAASEAFETRWVRGGAPVIRRLAERGAVELLGGPLTHAFQPLLDPEVASFGLSAGLDDAWLRLGHRPRGLWAPECGYRPGLAEMYAREGVTHFLMDGPTMRHVGASTAAAHPIKDAGVVAFGRDLEVTYRVWSPRRGYPGGRWYRDFHTYDHRWGFRHSRVTDTRSDDKAHYDPGAARSAVAADAADFVTHVRERLLALRDQRGGRPGLTVAAYDTELFGHWWYEGPDWLAAVLTQLPEAGVRVTTLSGAMEAGLVEDPIAPESGSWGAGKDWHVWDGEAVYDMVADNNAAQIKVLQLLKELPIDDGRVASGDQLVRDLMLALSSDWAFMVSHDSAAEYARRRHVQHHWSLAELADLIEHQGWSAEPALTLARSQAVGDGPFHHLDARQLAVKGR